MRNTEYKFDNEQQFWPTQTVMAQLDDENGVLITLRKHHLNQEIETQPLCPLGLVPPLHAGEYLHLNQMLSNNGNYILDKEAA